MTLEHVILGLLSVRPLSGYDLKKIMQESDFLYWSGNNNQIYKSLLQLCDAGCVAITIEHRDNAPLIKRYTLTEQGKAMLAEGLGTPAGIPEGKKPFLLHLAFAHGMSNATIRTWADTYAADLQSKIYTAEAAARTSFSPERTPREAALWSAINENIIDVYRHELAWLTRVTALLETCGEEAAPQAEAPDGEAEDISFRMEPVFIEGHQALYLPPDGRLIIAKSDAITCIETCLSLSTHLLMISGERLSERFVRLKTGLAGEVLQKLAQYRIRTAIIYTPDSVPSRFTDYIAEANRGGHIHVCETRAEAEAWLINDI